jgi:hypothetical protein
LRPEEEFTEHKITLGVRDEHVESVMFEIERFCEAFSEDTSGNASRVGDVRRRFERRRRDYRE